VIGDTGQKKPKNQQQNANSHYSRNQHVPSSFASPYPIEGEIAPGETGGSFRNFRVAQYAAVLNRSKGERMKKKAFAILGTLAAVASIGAPTAAAATEFGDNCIANEEVSAEVPVSLFALTAAGDPLPLVAPSTGVITQFKISQAVTPVPVTQTFEVLRTSGPPTVQVVGESVQIIGPGSNSFNTRLPVRAGDRLGLGAPANSPLLFCVAPGPENLLGIFASVPSGSSAEFEPIEAEARVPVSAVIEADADNDGYGDETQDKCPQVATAQAACPVVTLSATGTAKKTLASIAVTATSQATVTVKGAVKLGKGKSAKLSGGTQLVAPGTLAKYTLLFPQKLRAALRALPAKRFLTLRVTASAPNIVGPASTKVLKLRVKGQAKPKKRSRQKKS
jgi:hypothetical protein